MKHTFKTLLLTTLLAMPAVFCADSYAVNGEDTAGSGTAELTGATAVTHISNFNKLQFDVLNIIIGYARPNEANPTRDENGVPVEWLGFAGNLDMLLALSKTSKAFNRRAQPLIAVYQPVISRIVDPFFTPNVNNDFNAFKVAADKLFTLGAYRSYILVWKKSAELFPHISWMTDVSRSISLNEAKGAGFGALSLALLEKEELPSAPINIRKAIEKAILIAKAILLKQQGFLMLDSWEIRRAHPAGRGSGILRGYTSEGKEAINASLTDDQMLRALWNIAQSKRESFTSQ